MRDRKNKFNKRGRGKARGSGPKRNERREDKNFKNKEYVVPPEVSALIPPQNTERDIGISKFCNEEKIGFSVYVKERYSDFIVNEIDLCGDVVVLKNAPGIFWEKMPRKDANKAVSEDDKEIELKSGLEKMKEILGDSVTKSLLDFLKSEVSLTSNESKENGEVYQNKAGQKGFVLPKSFSESKESRKKVHESLRQNLGNLLESSTLTDNSNKTDKTDQKEDISNSDRIFIFEKKFANKIKKHFGKEPWPSDLPPYLKFALYKENTGTMECASMLAEKFSISKNHIGFSGTKDKRAITTQYFTAYKTFKEKLENYNFSWKSRSKEAVTVAGNFSYVDEPLRLGSLKGNRFSVVLREAKVSGSDDKSRVENVVREAWDKISKYGFINYFGFQRFGSGGSGTHLVGFEIMKQNWKKAVELIMLPRSNEYKNIHKAKLAYLTESASPMETYSSLPKHCIIERMVMLSLAKNGESGHQKAIESLPKQTKTLYIHAAQSYFFNRASNHRVELYGSNEPVIGDLVREIENVEDFDCLEDDEELEDADEQHQDKKIKLNDESSDVEELGNEKKIRVLTEDDILAKKFNIFDLVLPLPGYSVVFPQNLCGKKFYEELLKEQDLDLNAFRSKASRYFNLKGTYRSVVVKPNNISLDIRSYTDNTVRLIPTDLDRLKEVHAQSKISDSENVNERQKEKENDSALVATEDTQMDKQQGEKLAVCLVFDLPVSSYATMMLRELTNGNINAPKAKELVSTACTDS